ncbi:hypothetical protein GCM10027294_25750 [Marinactinospora endophytica]
MSDEPSAWELQRSLADMRTDLREGFAQVNARLDRVVSSDLFSAYQVQVAQRFAEVEKDLATLQTEVTEERKAHREEHRADERQRAADRKWVMSAIVVPIVLLLAQWVAPMLGVGS